MAKKKISIKQKKSEKPYLVEHIPGECKDLANKQLVREILIDCLVQNDIDTFQDVLIGYLRTTSKSALARNAKIGRTTLYDLIDPSKPFNPTLDTLGKIFEDLAA
jgi:hypothetical protein